MPAALLDLEESRAYIAEESERAANRWLEGAWEKIFSLQDDPEKYALIKESEILGRDLRSLHYYSHRIIYWLREREKVVEVIRVYHSARRPLGS